MPDVKMFPILAREFMGNPLQAWLVALAILCIGFMVVGLLRRQVAHRLSRWAETDTVIDDLAALLWSKLGAPAAGLGVVFVAAQPLHLGPRFETGLRSLLTAGLTFLAVRFLVSLVKFHSNRYFERNPSSLRARSFQGASSLLVVLIWTVGFVFALDNLGFEISTLLAGLGIGGIAVALAAQAVLGDFFAYFALLFDRPFEIGDPVEAGDFRGTVEELGLKTTRLRGNHGEELVIPNSDLARSRLRNTRRLEGTRVIVRFSLPAASDPAALAGVTASLRQAAAVVPGSRLLSTSLTGFGPHGPEFELAVSVVADAPGGVGGTREALHLAVLGSLRSKGLEPGAVG